MKKLLQRFKRIGIFILSFIAILPAMSLADCGDGANVPAGSYRQTCINCLATGGNLTATCKKINQQYIESTLYSYSQCRTGIANADGFLTCDRGDSDSPEGSYKASCIQINTQQNVLYARCRKVNGAWQESSLPLGHCNYQIYNLNGILACALPYGSFQQSCRNSRVLNNRLYSECKTKRGQWVNASLSMPCNTEISNNNGALQCN